MYQTRNVLCREMWRTYRHLHYVIKLVEVCIEHLSSAGCNGCHQPPWERNHAKGCIYTRCSWSFFQFDRTAAIGDTAVRTTTMFVGQLTMVFQILCGRFRETFFRGFWERIRHAGKGKGERGGERGFRGTGQLLDSHATLPVSRRDLRTCAFSASSTFFDGAEHHHAKIAMDVRKAALVVIFLISMLGPEAILERIFACFVC